MSRPPDDADFPQVLKVSDLARVLGIGRRHSYKLVADGTIRSVRVGRAIRIPRSALVEFLDGSAAAGR